MSGRGTVLLVRLTHRYMTETVHELVRRGYRVRVLGTLDSTRFLSEQDGVDTSPPRRRRPTPAWWPLPRATRDVLDLMDDDCVLVVTKRGKRDFLATWLATRIRRVPLVFRVEVDAHWDPTGAGPRLRLQAAAQRVRRRAEQLVLRAPGFTPRHGPGTTPTRGDLRYLPPPVATELATPPVLPDLPLRVITVTRCRPKKHNPGLLALATELRDDPVVFRVIFSDDEDCHRCHGRGADDFRAEVERAGLTGVVVSGPVGDVTPHYREAHVLLRNSLWEGANTTPMEGAAQGCIPLVSPTSGTAYGFITPEVGAIVDADDVAGQAAFLRGLIADVPRRERMRAAALRRAEDLCDPDRLVTFLEGRMR